MVKTRSSTVSAEVETRERRFRRLVNGGIVAYIDPFYIEALNCLGLLEPGGFELAIARESMDGEHVAESVAPDAHRSRGPSAVFDLPGHSDRLHLRLFHHGGWLGGALGGQLFGLTRPLNELKVNAALELAGAPVPQPVFAIGERTRGPFFRAAFGTLHVERSQNGVELLGDSPGREGRTLDSAAAAGAAIRRFHDAGARHPDLHLGNLLFSAEEHQIQALVIDLDRAEVGPPPGPRGRMAELMRLHRSVVKRGLLEVIGARGCARFFDAYTGGDRALRRAMLAHLPLERARLALHRLAY